MQKLSFINSLGKSIDFTSGNFGITNWEGLASVDLEIQSQRVPLVDGSVYIDSLINDRELNFTLAMYDGSDLSKRYNMRRELVSVLNPKLGEGELHYINDYIHVKIKCVPHVPIFENHNSNDSGTPKAGLTFTACNPYWEDINTLEYYINNGETINIENTGDTEVNLKTIFLTGDIKNPKLKNFTTGQTIHVTGEFHDNIEIDTSFGNKGITQDIYSKKLKGMVYDDELNFYSIQKLDDSLLIMPCSVNSDTYYAGYKIAYNFHPNENTVKYNYMHNNYSYKVKQINAPEMKYILITRYNLFFVTNDFYNFSYLFSGWISSYGNIIDILYNGNNLILVGTKKIKYHVSGTTWNDGWTSQGTDLIGAGIYQNKFIAFFSDSAIESTDGTTWNNVSINLPLGYSLSKVFNVSNLFFGIAVNGDDKCIVYSADGVDWSNVYSINFESDIFDIIYNGNTYVAYTEAGNIVESANGTEWIEKNNLPFELIPSNTIDAASDTKLMVNYMEGFGGINYILCKDGYIRSTSDFDSYYTINNQMGFETIAKNKKGWYVCTNKTKVYYGKSLDKLVKVSNVNARYYNSITTNGDYFVFINDNSRVCKLIISETGETTIQYSDVIDSYLTSLCFFKDKFIACSSLGIFHSDDGVNWVVSVRNNISAKICMSENKILIKGGGGYFHSDDGINWDLKPFPSINCILYGDGTYLMSASRSGSSVIFKSTNGIDWIEYPVDFSFNYGVFFRNKFYFYDEITSKFYSFYIDTEPILIDVIYSDWVVLSIIDDELLIPSSIGLWTIYKSGKISIINELSEQSDMSFKFVEGTNKVQFTYDEGYAVAKIEFNNRYIGV